MTKGRREESGGALSLSLLQAEACAHVPHGCSRERYCSRNCCISLAILAHLPRGTLCTFWPRLRIKPLAALRKPGGINVTSSALSCLCHSKNWKVRHLTHLQAHHLNSIPLPQLPCGPQWPDVSLLSCRTQGDHKS